MVAGQLFKHLFGSDIAHQLINQCLLKFQFLHAPSLSVPSLFRFLGVERSFSTMNRLCTRLRQRLTPDHLSHLLLIAQEGPEVLTRENLKDLVYVWYSQKPRRIQLPPPAV